MASNPTWAGRPVADKKDAQELDLAAAAHEFGEQSVPRDQAERLAYAAYVRQKHVEAAAHHWRGLQQAQAVGDSEVAATHKLMYDVHVRELGENPAGAVPAEVKRLAGDLDQGQRPRFKAHPADALPLLRCEPLLGLAVKGVLVQALRKGN